MSRGRGLSLRRVLMLGILTPVLAFIGINSVSLYRQALQAADVAYDRTLLASAKSIGEQLELVGDAGRPRLHASVPYSALEAFEADMRSRMFYKVSDADGRMVSGYDDLPTWRGPLPDRNLYAALVHFYDDRFRGEAVRVAVLLQPVSGDAGIGMATIQVAETLELRHTLARELLVQTAWQQGALLAVIAVVVVAVVQFATRPVRELSRLLQARPEGDLSALPIDTSPRELRPFVEAINEVMGRLDHLLRHQKRFIRDTSHQLRTPLAVLKAQVQSARRGDVAPEQALREIDHTVDSATTLANQMLALAKVEQLRQQGEAPGIDAEPILRAVALDMAPLIAQGRLDFELQTLPARVRVHEWSLRELARNLLHNAIKHTPPQGLLAIGLRTVDDQAVLTVDDGGPGIGETQRQRLFQPFAAGDVHSGSGLGLAICLEIVRAAGGSIALDNRTEGERTVGLRATVQLPLADNAA